MNPNVNFLVQIIVCRSRERHNSESLKPPVKHVRGSVMVWGDISANGVGGDVVKTEF